MKALIFFISILFISCSSVNKNLEDERTKWHYKKWPQDFKDYTFCTCLLKGYGDKNVVDKIKTIDKSYASVINYAIFDSTVQRILYPIIVQMKKDSLQSILTVSEYGAGKRVFDACLFYYKSKKLDSITTAESKKWGNIKSIDSLILKTDPAY